MHIHRRGTKEAAPGACGEITVGVVKHSSLDFHNLTLSREQRVCMVG
jgi:hypothetical protein